MSISRRSFFSAVAGAIAGAVASKALADSPETVTIASPPMAGKSTGLVEFCRQYLPQQKIEPWQEDVLVRIEAAKLSANVKVPACLIEDSMVDWSAHVYRKFAREYADRVDRECWAMEGLRPLSASQVAKIMDVPVEMLQHGPHKAADGQPAVDPKERYALARGRFDFTLDPHSPPR